MNLIRLAVGTLLALSAYSQPYRVTGTVIQALSRKPAEKVIVRLYKGGVRGVRQRFVTGADGRFAFEGLAAGKWNLTAERRGYYLHHYGRKHPLTDGGVAVVTGAQQITEGLVFLLQPPGMIFGRITDEFEDPVVGANVYLHASLVFGGRRLATEIRKVVTDGDGGFAMGGLAEGRYYLSVTAKPWYSSPQMGDAADEVFAPHFYPGTADPRSAAAIAVKAGEEVRADLTMRAVKPALLKLKRVNFASVSFSITHVGVMQTSLSERSILGTSPVNRALTSPGKHTVWIQNEEKRYAKILSLDLAPGENLIELPEALGAQIQVHIEGKGIPREHLSKALVRIQEVGSGWALNRTISADGQVRTERVPAGRYSITVNSLPTPNSRHDSISAEGAPVKDWLVEVVDGATAKITVVLTTESARVEGQVADGARPIAGALVVLIPGEVLKNQVPAMGFVTDSDGSFEFQGLPPGEFGIIVLENSDIEYSERSVAEKLLENAEKVKAIVGETIAVKLKPPPAR